MAYCAGVYRQFIGTHPSMSARYGPDGGQITRSDDDSDRVLFEALKTKGIRRLCDIIENMSSWS